MKENLQGQREDIIRRLFQDSGLPENLTTEVKEIARTAFKWGVLLERERHMLTKDRNTNPNVFSPWSYDAGSKVKDQVVQKLQSELAELKTEIARLNAEALKEEAICCQVIQQRDFREEQIDTIADLLGDKTEWTSDNDRGANAIEILDRENSELSKYRELVGSMGDAIASMVDNIEHYYENKCIPTSDEFSQARAALELIGGKK